MGKLCVYRDVDPWRSIFDTDDVEPIARFRGDCGAVDAFYDRHPDAKSTDRLTTRRVTDRLLRSMGKSSPPTGA